MDSYWQRLVETSQHNKTQGELVKTNDLSDIALAMAPKRVSQFGPAKRRRPRCGHRIVLLGRSYPNIYLTEREAHCALLLLRGCTSRETALQMHLSSRTVEYYLSNVKSKLGLRRKSGVISVLLESDFIQNLRHMTLCDVDKVTVDKAKSSQSTCK